MARSRWLRYAGGLGRRALAWFVAALSVAFVAVLSIKYAAPPTVKAIADLGPDPSAVLFGVATVALTVMTILLGLLGFFGWASIREKVDFEVSRKMEEEREFDLANARLNVGAIYGVLAQYFLYDDDPGTFIEYAIAYNRKALVSDALKDTEVELVAQNNLAYSLALRAHRAHIRGPHPNDTVADAAVALELAREAWRKASGSKDKRLAAAMTLGRVTAEFALAEEDEPARCLRKAIGLVEGIAREQPLDERQQREMDRTLRRLRESIEEAERVPDHSDSVGNLVPKLWNALWQGRWKRQP